MSISEKQRIYVDTSEDFGKTMSAKLKDLGYSVQEICDKGMKDNLIARLKDTENEAYIIAKSKYGEALKEGHELRALGLRNGRHYFIAQELKWQGLLDAPIEIKANINTTVDAVLAGKVRNINRVLFFSSCSHAGKFFMCSLLDGHPNILGCNPSTLMKKIMYIVRGAAEKSGNDLETYIISSVEDCFLNDEWKEDFLDREDAKQLPWMEEFKNQLHRLLEEGKCYSEKEIFLIIMWSIHFTFYGEYSSEIDPIIFTDVHDSDTVLAEYLNWFSGMGFQVTILEAVRQSYIKIGSFVRFWGKTRGGEDVLRNIYYCAHEIFSPTEKEYEIIRYRFEDLKLHPKVVLKGICQRMSIPWDDSLLNASFLGQATTHMMAGEVVKGFSLKQVWYPYDEYFDAFDRFRMDLLFREKNRAYGYSYVPKEKYPISEDKLVELFRIPFKFENHIQFNTEQEKEVFRENMVYLAENLLSMFDNEDFKDTFWFGPYILTDKEN